MLFLVSFFSVVSTKCQLSGSKNYCNGNYCYLKSNTTGQVGETLTYCFNQSTSTYHTVYISFKGDIHIELNLPDIFSSLSFNLNSALSNVTICSSKSNPNITRLSFNSYTVSFSQPSFFNFFPNLKSLYTSSFLNFVQSQNFSGLSKLTSLSVKPRLGSSTWKFDFIPTAFHGLTNLKYVELVRSDITDVRYTFKDVPMLTHLGLEGNKIEELEPDMFTDLGKLNYLDLDGNGIKIASVESFNGLTALKYLTLSGNPSFPLNSLSRLSTLTRLYINYNSYQTLAPGIFEQMPSLKYIYADNPFFCDCSLLWTSLVSKYGLRIYSAYCSEPSNVYRTAITSPFLYTNCTQNNTYECFSKTTSCPTDFVCRDTNSGHACTCIGGYSLTHNGDCIDEDECQLGLAHCAQNCNNTLGSFECYCNAGYKLAADSQSCEDVDECEVGLVDCTGTEICVNEIGSYECKTVGCPTFLVAVIVQAIVNVFLLISLVVVIVVARCYVKRNKFKTTFQPVSTLSDNAYGVLSGDANDDVNLLEAANTSGVGEKSVDLYPAPIVNTPIN